MKNLGFIEKTFDLIHDNPKYASCHFDVSHLKVKKLDMESFYQLSLVLGQFSDAPVKACHVKTDSCCHDALRIFKGFELLKNDDTGARVLYDSLSPFFNHKKKKTEENE